MAESYFKRIFKLLILIILILLVVCLYRAFVVIKPCNHKIEKVEPNDYILLDQIGQDRLIEALKIRTITFNENSQNLSAIDIFGQFIRKEFHELEAYGFVEFEFVNKSLFYKINGINSNLKPYLFAAHFDVVPAENNWDFDPFDAQIVDSFIYARGTLDDKSSVIAQLEAVKMFLAKFGQPKRTLYLGITSTNVLY